MKNNMRTNDGKASKNAKQENRSSAPSRKSREVVEYKPSIALTNACRLLNMVEPYVGIHLVIKDLQNIDLSDRSVLDVIWKGYDYVDSMSIVTVTWAEIVRQDFPQLYEVFVACLLKYGAPAMIEAGAVSHLQMVSGEVVEHVFYSQLVNYCDDNTLVKATTVMKYPSRFASNTNNQSCLYEFVGDQSRFRMLDCTCVDTVTHLHNAEPLIDYSKISCKVSRITGYVSKRGTIKYLDKITVQLNHPTEMTCVEKAPRYLFRRLKYMFLDYFNETADGLSWENFGPMVWYYCKHNKMPIPTGSCADTGKDLVKKIAKITVFEREIASCRSYDQFKSLVASKDFGNSICKLITVPKNYKSRRLIATVPVCCQSIGMVVQRLMIKFLSIYNAADDNLPEVTLSEFGVRKKIKSFQFNGVRIAQSEQHVARNCAQLGSIDNSIDTIDQSHASDRILFDVLSECVPTKWDLHFWLIDIVPRRASYVDKNGDVRVIKMASFAPAGYANTFNMESLYFGNIGALSVELVMIAYDRLYLVSANADPELHPYGLVSHGITVVGDDMATDKIFTETVIDLLTCFNAKVNEDKTFKGSSSFRESCGGDYFMGMDVTPLYFPRKEWKFQFGVACCLTDVTQENVGEFATTFTSMCALAKRLYKYPSAQGYVVMALMSVKDIHERITCSNDVDETGIRTMFARIVQNYTDHYVDPDVRNQYRYKNDAWFKRTNNIIGDRRFISPTVVDALREEYEKYRNRRPFDKKILTSDAIERMDAYLYDVYLCNGPDYSDDILRKAGVSQKRKI